MKPFFLKFRSIIAKLKIKPSTLLCLFSYTIDVLFPPYVWFSVLYILGTPKMSSNTPLPPSSCHFTPLCATPAARDVGGGTGTVKLSIYRLLLPLWGTGRGVRGSRGWHDRVDGALWAGSRLWAPLLVRVPLKVAASRTERGDKSDLKKRIINNRGKENDLVWQEKAQGSQMSINTLHAHTSALKSIIFLPYLYADHSLSSYFTLSIETHLGDCGSSETKALHSIA